jgi:2-hydroxy-3-keto-5-methylthiopentenyl-1-phosphate phosphatase
MRVFADFDGTIARPDVTDVMLQRFASPAWERIEAEWIAGVIDAATCMRRQIALIEARPEALNAALDEIELDPDFPAFARWCDEAGIKLAIVSDGVDYFIHRILERHGLGTIPVFANALKTNGSRHTLEHPWLNDQCAAQQGVCKCAVTRAALRPLIFVGDGRSDQCVSQIADVVFAKGKLAAFCAKTDRDYVAFTTFAEIQAGVASLLLRSGAKNAPVAD